MSQSRSSSRGSSRRSSRRKRKFKRKVSNFTKSVGISPLQIALSLFLLVGVVVFIYVLGFSEIDLSRTAVASPAEVVKEQEGLDKLLKGMLEQRLSDPKNFLLSIDQIQETEREISNIEASHSLTSAQQESIARIRLKNKGSTVLQMKRAKVSHVAERADLIRFCRAYENTVESDVRLESRFWLCAVPAIEFSFDPSEETIEPFIAAIEEYEDSYINSPEHAATLGKILNISLADFRKRPKLIHKGVQGIAQHFGKSELATVRNLGERLLLLEMFGEYNLETLGNRIAWHEPSAIEDLEGSISALSNNLDSIPLGVWDEIIRSYECYLAGGNVKKVGEVWQRMWTLSERIKSVDTMKQVQLRLRRQKHRAMSIGSRFDISGTAAKNGEPIDFGNHEYIAIIFFDSGSDSSELIKKLVVSFTEKQPTFFSVLAFNKGLDQKHLDRMKDSRTDVTVVDVETAKKYYEELLVDITPYIVLVDRSGKILNTRLQFDQLENRIAQLKAKNSITSTATP